MSIRAFTGAAGTGKTTRLMRALQEHLAREPLGDGQRILALTRMHGSRHRLIDRLGQTSARGRFDCHTFDRFAWDIVSRWRSLAREIGTSIADEFDYDGTCELASKILSHDVVARWVARRYPIVVIDEFQDCRGGRLGIATHLASRVDLLVAADEFQDLHQTGASDALAWLRAMTAVEELTVVHRTSDAGLLGAATALREGQPLRDEGSVKVFAAPNANVAAGYLARGIKWSGRDEIVLISSTTLAKSPFVRDTLARMAKGPIGSGNKAAGPYEVGWEQSRDGLESQLCERLSLPDDPAVEMTIPTFSAGQNLPCQRDLEDWFAARRRLRGDALVSAGDVRNRVRRAVQHLRALPRRSRGPCVMTIHQAKNREFDRVLILWTVNTGGDAEAQRRLLYNAVTRAKKAATIIVQDPKPKQSRLALSPFLR